MDTGFFSFTLISATLLCSLAAGFLLAFAIVTMPGIGNLSNREFIRAFQVIDGVIQNRQPLFMGMWLGSVAALLACTALGIGHLAGWERTLLICAAAVYLVGVQLPTFTINVPLNDLLQTLDVDAMSEEALRAARDRFEPRWNRWNTIRTAFAILTSAQLLVVLFRS